MNGPPAIIPIGDFSNHLYRVPVLTYCLAHCA